MILQLYNRKTTTPSGIHRALGLHLFALVSAHASCPGKRPWWSTRGLQPAQYGAAGQLMAGWNPKNGGESKENDVP